MFASAFFHGCSCQDAQPTKASTDLHVVQLSSDVTESHVAQPIHLLTRTDSFDTTVLNRSLKGDRPRPFCINSRERAVKSAIKLPFLQRYPSPPGVSDDVSEDIRRQELLKVYQEFALDLNLGIYLTQLTATLEYVNIHCQLLDDLKTLKVDQGNGCVIEFPLCAVAKIHRVIKNGNRWHSTGSLTGPIPMVPLPISTNEHIVVVEFMRRKLAFVFSEVAVAQRFTICMELLVRHAKESETEIKFNKGNQITPVFSAAGIKNPGERLGKSNLGHPCEVERRPSAQLCACQPEGN